MENIPSLLDKDDMNGPSKGNFPRSSRSLATDYALFKISLFDSSENVNDKLKFVKDLDSLVIQLGSKDLPALFPVLKTIVNSD